jgi:hypothetical protein
MWIFRDTVAKERLSTALVCHRRAIQNILKWPEEGARLRHNTTIKMLSLDSGPCCNLLVRSVRWRHGIIAKYKIQIVTTATEQLA